MSLQRRILLASILVICGGVLLACTGTGDRKGRSSERGDAAAVVQKSDDAANPLKSEKEETRAKARSQAEADAHAKDEANQQAYQAAVERANAEFELRKEKYQFDKEAFGKDMPIYLAAKAEVNAAKKMNLARSFFNEKEMEIARRRLRELIDSYPSTHAAKDAKVILSGGSPIARKALAEPIEPTMPIEPRLILPRPPEPVVVVYPPEPEEQVAERLVADQDFKNTSGGDYQTPLKLSNGKTVYVRGHFRANGTYVSPHVRAQPGSGSSGGGRKK